MNLVDYEKYYHSGSEFIIPRDEFEKIIEENQRLNNVLKKIKKYCVDNIYSDSCTKLTSGKITDVCYCIDALEDILDILKELKESDK